MRPSITRKEFIEAFMHEGEMPYATACKAYEIMCRRFEEGICSGSKIGLGRVGALTPVWQNAREFKMHFVKMQDGKVKTGVHRTYAMDGRFKFKFKLYKRFANTRKLRWLE